MHSSPEPLRQALEIFHREQVGEIICAGDIAGYYDTLLPTIELLVASNCKAIAGNHDQEYLEKPTPEDDQSIRYYLQNLPLFLDLQIEQKRLYAVHASPPCEQHGGIKLLDQQGNTIEERINEWTLALSEFDYDVLIVGHTHQVYAERIGKLLVVNPGSSVFNHSCMILSLPDMEVETFALGNQALVKCWNFGMLFN